MVQYAIRPLQKFSSTRPKPMHKDASRIRRAICALLINADNLCGLWRAKGEMIKLGHNILKDMTLWSYNFIRRAEHGHINV